MPVIVKATSDPTIKAPLNKVCLELFEEFVKRGVIENEAAKAAAQVYSGAARK